MNQSKTKLTVVAALLLCLAAGAGFVAGQGSGVRAQETTAVSGTVAPLLQYQGRLTDPETGEILPDGLYTMTFRLYTGPSGGSALWTETKDVPVKAGLFSTALGDTTKLNQGLFSGQALWLGVKVGADAEAVPRQEVLPVAYALGLLPGAAVQASNSKPTLTLSNAGTGPALEADGPVGVKGDLNVEGALVGGNHNHNNYVDWYSFDSSGIIFAPDLAAHTADSSAHHSRYTDAEAVAAAESSPNIIDAYYMALHEADSSAHHSRYSNSEAVNAVKAADGSGSGLDADLLDGKQAGDFATAGHRHVIASGNFWFNCEKRSGTDNFSCYWNPDKKYYEITFDFDYVYYNFITLVNSSDGYYGWTDGLVDTDNKHKLIIRFEDGRNTRFQFVTFSARGF